MHLASYEGWPNVFSAMPVAKDVFESAESSVPHMLGCNI
jgi:alkylhydroperoxidase/carboxymuconolactone decarboxylase family protein YurZ